MMPGISFSIMPLVNLLSAPNSPFFANLRTILGAAPDKKDSTAKPSGGGLLGPYLASQIIGQAARSAAGMMSPDQNPATYAASVGGSITAFSTMLAKVNPVLGGFGMALGGATEAASGMMQAMDGMVERYAKYNPELAQAKAQADVAQIFGDIRRSKEAAPTLIRYLQQRTEMQQRIEERKLAFMDRMMPTMMKLMELAEALAPMVEGIVGAIMAVVNVLTSIGGSAQEVATNSREKRDKEEPGMSPWELIEKGYRLPGGKTGIRTPDL